MVNNKWCQDLNFDNYPHFNKAMFNKYHVPAGSPNRFQSRLETVIGLKSTSGSFLGPILAECIIVPISYHITSLVITLESVVSEWPKIIVVVKVVFTSLTDSVKHIVSSGLDVVWKHHFFGGNWKIYSARLISYVSHPTCYKCIAGNAYR